MILVGRPPIPPKPLARGIAVTATNCAARDASLNEYEAGERKFTFTKSIYGSAATKRKFALAQHSKCCFCEAIFDANVSGDVEHYRPKKAIRTDSGLIFPGYYWLAYAFDNLFYACPDCNQYKKKNWFPLGREAARARSHHDNVLAEQPLLLNPLGPVNPRRHIRFDRDFPVGLTPAGRKTIRVLGLDREPLNRDRRRVLGGLRKDISIINLWGGDQSQDAVAEVNLAKDAVKSAVLPDAEFSAAAQDFVAGWRAP